MLTSKVSANRYESHTHEKSVFPASRIAPLGESHFDYFSHRNCLPNAFPVPAGFQ
jgi:hypothetical protein